MGRLLVAILLCAWMPGSARADQVMVSTPDQSDAATLKRLLDRFVESESLATDRQIDVGVVRLEVEPGDVELAVVAELRIAISDPRGQLLTVVSGTAKVSMPSASYRARILPTLRTEALVAAAEAMLPKLRAHLHHVPGSRIVRWNIVEILGEWFARLSPPGPLS